jgi:hypothetical protein
MNRILTIILFLMISLISMCQNMKKIRATKLDREKEVEFSYVWKDKKSVAIIILYLFKNNKYEYSFKDPFIEDTLINKGDWLIKDDILILNNDLSIDKLPIDIDYIESKIDTTREWNLRILKDIEGREYRNAMVWINNNKMGCMSGMAVCITGPGFEKIDSVQIHFGRDIYSNWLRVGRRDCDIQLRILTSDDLTRSAFIGDKEFRIKRRKLIVLKN